jgi:hypothetical protein
LWGGENLYAFAPNTDGWIDPWGWASCSSTGKQGAPWTSKARYGHTFIKHGEGKKNTQKLKDIARSTGNNQGQWMDNNKAHGVLSGHADVTSVKRIEIPDGLGQVIKPDGTIVPTNHALIIPRLKTPGSLTTAYPCIFPCGS